MNHHLQPLHLKEMEDFRSANQAHGGELWKIENKNSSNNNNNTIVVYDHHRRSSESQVRRRIPEDYYHHHHPSSRISSSTACAQTASNNNKIIAYSRKSSWLNDPEVKRQRRVVKYKAYAVEGKMKASFRNGFRWVKNKYCQLVHGY